MADGEVRAQDLAQETASTLSGNEQFVMFDSTAGKRADIDDVATYVAGDKTTLKTTNKTSPVAAINENFDATADVKEDIEGFIENNNIVSDKGTKLVNVPVGGLTNAVVYPTATQYSLSGATTFIGSLECADVQITKLLVHLTEYDSNNTQIATPDIEPNTYYKLNSQTTKIKVGFKISTPNEGAADYVNYNWGIFAGDVRQFNDLLYINSDNVLGLDDTIDEAIDEAIVELKHSKSPMEFIPFENVNGVTNGCPYIQDNIVTQNGYQFCCFVNKNNGITAGKRSTVEGSQWEFADVTAFPVEVKPDGHYIISMGIDEEGAIHIAGGMHGNPMRYVRSRNPYDISDFVRFAHMVNDAIDENEVAYPQFVKKKDGGLLFFYRSGSNPYQYVINAFVTQPSHYWTRLVSNLITGDQTNGYPYLNHIATDSLGRIHIRGCWRSSENKDIFYMYNDNNGSSTRWKKTDGTTYTLPITQESCEIIQDISSANNGLLNQNGMFCDDDNNPHIAYFKVDSNDHTNIFHLYLKNGVWVNEQVTNYAYKVPTNLTSYEGQIARPSIFCYKGRTFILYRHNYMNEAGKLLLLEVTDYPATKQCVLFDANFTSYDFAFDTNAIANGGLHALVTNTTTSINESVDISIRYDELINWESQLSGVVSIDLNQIDAVLQNKIRIPSLKTVASSDNKIAIGYTALKKFVKATAHRTNTSNSKTHLYLTSSDGTQKEVGVVCMYSTSLETIKNTPYIPINVDENENVILSYEEDNNNVDVVTLEYAVLDY